MVRPRFSLTLTEFLSMQLNLNPIIPDNPVFYHSGGDHGWDHKAICVFAAIGFFLGDRTFFSDRKALDPGVRYRLGAKQDLEYQESYFRWHHQPKGNTFDESLKQYSQLFEEIIDQQVGDRQVILPLSGGLDSRTLLVALKRLGKKVVTYSYQFEGGYPETKIASALAQTAGYHFEPFEIPKGYLWNSIDRLADLNQCYAEFTHPRQMAVIDRLGQLGEVFCLGHWGDVLFESGAPESLQASDRMGYLRKKVLKEGGIDLGRQLWDQWGLDGDFDQYLSDRMSDMLSEVDLEHTGASIRAFKSRYWAPRWTSVNLAVFRSVAELSLPYYDNRMCELVCSLPENHLAGRQLQIEYIKKYEPALARITWQQNKPFNVYNYKNNRAPYNLPPRVLGKLGRMARGWMGSPFVQRNWELQFSGSSNRSALEDYLSSNNESLVPKSLVNTYVQKFYGPESKHYSHPLSMLLTLVAKSNKTSIGV